MWVCTLYIIMMIINSFSFFPVAFFFSAQLSFSHQSDRWWYAVGLYRHKYEGQKKESADFFFSKIITIFWIFFCGSIRSFYWNQFMNDIKFEFEQKEEDWIWKPMNQMMMIQSEMKTWWCRENIDEEEEGKKERIYNLYNERKKRDSCWLKRTKEMSHRTKTI